MGSSVVDWETLDSNFDNDRSAICLVLEVFLSAVDELLSQVKAAVDSGNPKALAMSAHSLKGAVSNFGAKAAVDFAQELESHGYEGIKGDEEQIFLALEMAIGELVEELRSRLLP